jgi:hypothetical protein
MSVASYNSRYETVLCMLNGCEVGISWTGCRDVML